MDFNEGFPYIEVANFEVFILGQLITLLLLKITLYSLKITKKYL
jgi:hypothetical protein